MEVKLLPYEAEMAALVGFRRMLESTLKHHDTSGEFCKDNPWDIHIEGAAAEAAYSKLVDKFWTGSVNTFKAADVGDYVQVRHSKHENRRLIVRPGDNDDHYFVFVTGKIPNFKVHGWILGRNAKDKQYWDTPNGGSPCYMVPIKDLCSNFNLMNEK
jgi:hypothetical protein